MNLILAGVSNLPDTNFNFIKFTVEIRWMWSMMEDAVRHLITEKEETDPSTDVLVLVFRRNEVVYQV